MVCGLKPLIGCVCVRADGEYVYVAMPYPGDLQQSKANNAFASRNVNQMLLKAFVERINRVYTIKRYAGKGEGSRKSNINKASLGLWNFALLLFSIVIDLFSTHSTLKLRIYCIPYNYLPSLQGTQTARSLYQPLACFVYGPWAERE